MVEIQIQYEKVKVFPLSFYSFFILLKWFLFTKFYIYICCCSIKVLVAQSCLTLCNPMDSTFHGILQARILEWVAFPFPGDLPNPGIKPRSPALQVNSLPAKQWIVSLKVFWWLTQGFCSATSASGAPPVLHQSFCCIHMSVSLKPELSISAWAHIHTAQ